MANSWPGTTNARTAGPGLPGPHLQARARADRWRRHVRALAYDEHVTNIVCSWHGYEFDLKTGVNQGSDKIKLRKVKLEEKDGHVYVVV